jgi:hypothetical protein
MARRDKIISSIPKNTSGLRFVRERKEALKNQEKYKESYKVIDEISEKTLAECDLYGHAGFVKLEIKDEQGNVWTTRPNRKVMPSCWSFFSNNDECLYKIKRPNVFLFMNPFRRTFFYLIDMYSNSTLKFQDLESSIGDQLFSTSPFTWSITNNKDVVATIKRLARKGEELPEKGFFNKFKRLFRSSDWVLLTPGSTPVLSAPVYLGLMLLLEEHTKNPAA